MDVTKCEKANKGEEFCTCEVKFQTHAKPDKTLPKKFQMLTNDTNDLAVLPLYPKALLICPKLSITVTLFHTQQKMKSTITCQCLRVLAKWCDPLLFQVC